MIFTNLFLKRIVGISSVIWRSMIPVVCLNISTAASSEPYEQVRGVMHIKSNYSTGTSTIEQIIEEGRESGLKVLVFADRDLIEVAYGVPFLRQLARFSKSNRALFSEGTLSEYLNEIRRQDDLYDDMIIIDGVESNPFYFWALNMAQLEWTLRFWNKNMVAVGMDSADAYRNLPTIGNSKMLIWRWESVLMLWPVVGLVYVFWLQRAGCVRVILGIVSALCLVNNALTLFKMPITDPYHGDLGTDPFQCYIDYVNNQGGLVFWSYPEMPANLSLNSSFGIDTETAIGAYAEDLALTTDYTGFSALKKNNLNAIDPGQEWDCILKEYLDGKRQSPVWGIGEVEDYATANEKQMNDIATVFLVRDLSRTSVLTALREGRHYAVRGGDKSLILSRFQIVSPDQSNPEHLAVSGQELEFTGGDISIGFSMEKLDGGEELVRIRLIRVSAEEVKVIDDMQALTPIDYFYADHLSDGDRICYRLLASSASSMLVSNPIFVSANK